MNCFICFILICPSNLIFPYIHSRLFSNYEMLNHILLKESNIAILVTKITSTAFFPWLLPAAGVLPSKVSFLYSHFLPWFTFIFFIFLKSTCLSSHHYTLLSDTLCDIVIYNKYIFWYSSKVSGTQLLKTLGIF